MKQDAKEKLIRSAIDVFADLGYREGKIAHIVEIAEANIAAVNYHFGSKDQLFVAALRQAFVDADEKYPIRGELANSASSRDKIAAVARAILLRSFDDGKAGNFNRMMSKTVDSPSSPIKMIMAEVEEFELKYLSSELALFMDTQCPQMVAWALSVFISLATMISKCPVHFSQKIFSGEPKRKQIDAMIESQIRAIFAALESLPTTFPK